MASQQVRLRWTTHQGTLVTVLHSLLGKEFLVDVTLAAEGQYVRAHKVILCACSPYFEELLSISEDKHPIILLQDVKYVQLQALISYMYCGEVNIDEENLPSLLRIAEALQIRGLFGSVSPAETESTQDTDSSCIATKHPAKCEIKNENLEPDQQNTLSVHKRFKSGHSTNSNSTASVVIPGKIISNHNQTNIESYPTTTVKESTDIVHKEAYVPSSVPNPFHNSASNKKPKAEKQRNYQSQATAPAVVETIFSKDKDTATNTNAFDSDSSDPSPSYLFDQYLSNDNDDSMKGDSLAPNSPTAEDDYKDEEHSQDGLSLGTDQVFRCVKCGKQYTSNKSLWRHRKFACEGKQTFSCQLCGKSFSRSDNLRRHAVVAHCIQ